MSATEIIATIHAGTAILKALQGCIIAVKELAYCFEEVAEYIRSSLSIIDALEGDVADLKLKVLDCRTLMSKAYDWACLYMDRVEKCLDSGDLDEHRRKKIKEDVDTRGDFRKVISYLKQLGRFFEQCTTCYENFGVFIDKAKEFCDECFRKCDKKKVAAKSSKSSWGKALMGAGAVVGVGGVAAVAGVFTFGVATPFIVGAASAATVGGTVTAVAGNAMSNVGEHHNQLEKEFRKIEKKFETMRDVASKLDENMSQVCVIQKRTQFAHKNTSETATQEEIDTFNDNFTSLLNGIKEDRKRLQEIKFSVQNSKVELDKIV